MNAFARRLYTSISFNFLTTLLNYSTFVLLANFASEIEFGRYMYLLAISSVAIVFTSFASEKIFAKVAIENNSAQIAINRTLGLKIIFFILFIGLFCITSILNLFSDVYLLCFLGANFFINGIYEFKLKIQKLSFYVFCEKLVFLLLCILFLTHYEFIVSVSLAYFISCLMLIFIQFYENKFEISSFQFLKKSEYFSHIFIFFPVYMLSLTQLSYGYTSRIILEDKFGLEQFAAISIAFQFINLFSIFQSRVDNFFRPLIIESLNNKKQRRKNLYDYLILALLPIVLMSVGLFFAAENLIMLFFGEKYASAASYLKILAPIAISISLFRLQDILFLAHEKNNLNLIIQLICAFLLIFLMATDLLSFTVNEYLSIVVMVQFIQVFVSAVALKLIKIIPSTQ